MRIKLLAVSVAGVAMLFSGMGSAEALRPQAELIDVHVIYAAKDKARPTGGANCSNDGATSSAYVPTGWVVQGAKTAHLNVASVPSSLGSVTSTMQTSLDVWRGADAAVPRITVATDGTITKPTANHSYDLMFGRVSGNSLAVTYTWRWSNGEIESDVIFNSGVPWFQAATEGDGCDETKAAYDVANIATHEFGHVYGLDHPSGARFNTMYAYGYTGETLKRSLGTGDAAGVASLY